MKHAHLPSGLLKGIAFIIPECWSPEQALAVFELLDDLRHQIWSHYQMPILELMHDQRSGDENSASLSLPFDEPPF
jgi:hypothetical protein